MVYKKTIYPEAKENGCPNKNDGRITLKSHLS